MKKSIVLAVLLVLGIVAALAGIKTLQIKALMDAGKSFAPPPETISSAVAHEEKWQDILQAVGSVTAVQGVNVTTELPGIAREIDFKSGAPAKQGDILVRLDTSAELAQLRALEAQANLAQIEAERLRKLGADKMVSESDLDTAEATLKQALANADAVRAAIGKKTIRAPFTGELGLRLINLGEYIDTGKPIVSLQALETVYADFSLPQQDLASLRTGMQVRLTSDAYPGQSFDGSLLAINPDLDAGTRTVRLRAAFDNPQHRLRPGMFARVEVLLPEEQPVLVVPITAVLSAPYGESVYVIESAKWTNGAPSGSVVRQQFIHTGQRRGDFVSVQTGLKAGERVASSGVFKLRNRMSVTENDTLVPPNSSNPHPNEG